MNITAYVMSRVFRRDLYDEVARLKSQDRMKSYFELGCVMAVLFGLAILAASFGWVGLGLYFLGVLVLFY